MAVTYVFYDALDCPCDLLRGAEAEEDAFDECFWVVVGDC